MPNSLFPSAAGGVVYPATPSLVSPCYFYCPALRLPKLLGKVDELSPGAVVIDLEDSIHPSEKAKARQMLETYDFGPVRARGIPIGLRINSIRLGHGLTDLQMLERLTANGPSIDFVLLPKLRHGAEVEIYRAHLDRLATPLMAVSFVETVDAVTEVDAIASLSDAIHYGQADLSSELYAPNPHYLAEAQARLTAAAAKYRIPAIDTNSFEIEDMSVVEAQSRASRGVGFTGKAAIHPSHVPIINKVFRTRPETLADCHATIEDYETQGCGFKIYGDRVVAPPFVAKARLVLDLHERPTRPLTPGTRRGGPRS
ncbi:MAG: aldolase/citrate lyase family protein [Rhodobacter sp.]|nr:aldolase/citrate lyase family protein [Rhodobacter sp.]